MKSNNNYVIINNRAYDPVTGLPVDGVDVQSIVSQPAPVVAKVEQTNRGLNMPKIHRTAQHSQTLSRRYVKKPLTLEPIGGESSQESMVAAYSPMSLQQFTVQKAETVQKFTPVKQAQSPEQKRADMPSQIHPLTQRATNKSLDIAAPQRKRANMQQKQSLGTRVHQTESPSQPKELKSAPVLKNEAILEAMNREMAPAKKTRAKKQRSSGRWARFISLSTASLAIVMLAGYFTYLNMPNLSLRMAAIQSGIDAKYPGYSPDGYALSGPITFKDGEVSMRFAYADNVRDFTLTQQRSSWDSTAVRQYVDSQSQNAATTQIDGLTIYTYEGNAAWVNGGILYTLKGDAPLSSEQIQRIATSI